MSVPANWYDTYTVVASPTDDSEIVIAILAGVGPLLPDLAVHLSAAVDIGAGPDTTAVQLTVRRGSLTGDTVQSPWSLGVADTGDGLEGNGVLEVVDFPGDFAGAVYVLTAICNNASGASVVNSVGFHARVD